MSEDQTTDQAMIAALRHEAERVEEDATYSSKSHFNAEDTWVRRHYWLGIPATVLAAIAGATLIKSRNQTLHTYQQKIADEIAGYIVERHYPLFLYFQQKMDSLKATP